MKPRFILLTFALTTFLFQCNRAQNSFTLSADDFAAKLTQTNDAIVLDVRTPQEFAGGFLDHATNLDYNAPGFQLKIDSMDKSKAYFVYCLSGGRSRSAANYMRSQGFKQVYDMKGGLLAWQKNKHPLVTAGSRPAADDKISMQGYEELISKENLVLIDFYAPWCGPCKKMEPMISELAEENEGKLYVVRLNVDENKNLVKQLGIEEIPVLKIFKAGKEIWTHKGLIEKQALINVLSQFQ